MKFVRHINLQQEGFAADVLSSSTGLSKSIIKDCLNKGAVWLNRSGKKEQRIRKAKFRVLVADRLSLYFDDTILNQPAPEPHLIFGDENYSIWNKPAGLLSQGTHYGDYCSLLRFAEKTIANNLTAHLIHRLDREARGLVLLAHNKTAAARFSELFRTGKIEKRYEAVAEGLLGKESEILHIEESLDGKSASTIISVLVHDEEKLLSTLDINLQTGRYHQIRRHLSGIGHPLVGDLRYGGKKHTDGLMLQAYKLSFVCPFGRKKRCFSLK